MGGEITGKIQKTGMRAINRAFAGIVSATIANTVMRHRVRGLISYGLLRALGIRIKVWRNRNIKPKYQLAVCLIAKNEGRYLPEWIEWHKSKGASKFYIYDNESDDNTAETLRPYISKGLVEYTFFPGKKKQLDAYQDCLEKHRFDARWIAFIDADEFIVPLKYKSIPKFLENFEQFSAVEINWLCYGSGGAKKRKPGGVMERFRAHSTPDFHMNRHVKSIVNPRRVTSFVGAHEAVRLSGKAADTNGNIIRKIFMDRPPLLDKIRINHYAIKSLEEFMEKRARGRARPGSMRQMNYFERYDQNDIKE